MVYTIYGPVVLVCLANNWPWPDHSNIASYGPVYI